MLTGNLVRLRPVEMTDTERFYVWINDPEVKRFLESRYLFSMAQEEEFVRSATLRTSPPHLTLAIVTLAESKHIGAINLHAFVSEDRRATLGIMIGDKTCSDHGYGTDAIVAMLRYGFEELNLNRIDLTCDERNARGIACYRKCGFVEEGRLRQHRFSNGRYRDTVVMAVLAEEFAALHGRIEAEA